MKKYAVLSVILALVLTAGMLSFTACGKKEEPQTTAAVADPQANNPADELFGRFTEALEKGSVGTFTPHFTPELEDLVNKVGEEAEVFIEAEYLIYNSDSIDVFFSAFYQALNRANVDEFHIEYEVADSETVMADDEAGWNEMIAGLLELTPDYQFPNVDGLNESEIIARVLDDGENEIDELSFSVISLLRDNVWKITLIGCEAFEFANRS